MNPRRVAVTVLASAGMAGTFLPWAGNGIFGVAGTVGDGWLTLAAFLGALLIAVLGKRAEPLPGGMRACIALLCAVAACVGLLDASKVSAAGSVNLIGSGLYLVCAVSIALGLVMTLGGRWWHAAIPLFALVATGAAGAIHLVYGDSVGFHVCPKRTWSLVDTFFDADDIVGTTYVSAVAKHGRAVGALLDCEVFEGFDLRSDAETCRIGSEGGFCMDQTQCNGETRRGVCEGASNIICCVPMLKAP